MRKIENSSYKKYTKELLYDLTGRIDFENRSTEGDLVAFQKWTELVKKWLMYVVTYRFSKSYDDIMKGTYKEDMFFDTNHQESIKVLKSVMREFVYDSPEILKLELSAKKIIHSLLEDFIYAVLYWEDEGIEGEMEYTVSKANQKLINMIPTNYKDDYMHARTTDKVENLYLRFLMVTDYISSMTDTYAKNLYQELNGIV